MKRYERLNTLLESLAEKGAIDVDELAEQLHVSAATIRRDLDHLGKQQLLTRTRGGAVANAVSYDLPLRYKTARFASEKQRIAQAAATLVRRGMVIGMNGGTTIAYLKGSFRPSASRISPGTISSMATSQIASIF